MKNGTFLKLCSIVLAFVLMAGLAACGKTAPAAQSEVAASSAAVESAKASETEKEKVTINFAAVYTPEHPFGPTVGQILDQFVKDHPEVTLERQLAPGEQLAEKINVQFASGTMPEVFVTYVGAGSIGKYGKGAIDLTEYLDADQNWKDGFIAGALDNYRIEGMPGIYAAPLGAFCVGFYYNKEMFQKANIEPPKTWKELQDVIAKLKSTGVTPWALGGKDSWRAEHLASNIFYKLNGVQGAKDLGSRKLAYDSAEFLSMYKAMVELNDLGAFGKTFAAMDYAGEIAAFNNEKAAMRMSGSWTVGETTGKDAPAGIKEKVGFFPFPYFEGKEATKDDWMGGTSDAFAISASTNGHQREMAIQLVKTLTSSESSKLIIETAHDLTAVKADVDPAKAGTLLAEVSKAMGTGKSFGGDFVGFEADAEVNKKAYDFCQAVLIKSLTPEEAAKKLMEQIKKNEGKK